MMAWIPIFSLVVLDSVKVTMKSQWAKGPCVLVILPLGYFLSPGGLCTMDGQGRKPFAA